MEEEGEGGSNERGVLQLSQDTGSQEDRRSLKVNGTAWRVFPVQLPTGERREKRGEIITRARTLVGV